MGELILGLRLPLYKRAQMLRQFLTCFILFCSQVLSAQWDYKSNQDAKINIGNNDEFAGFELLDTPMSQSRLLLLGQNSEFGAFNRKLEYKTLRYLQQKFGLRQHLLVVSPNQAWWINRYIVDGDTLAESMMGVDPDSRYFKMYQGIKKLNNNLTAEKKIRITGIDFETSPEMCATRIAGLLPDSLSVPQKLLIGVETVKAVSSYCITKKILRFEPGVALNNESNSSDYGSFSARKSMFSFLSIYDSLRPAFQSWLGSRFAAFDSAVLYVREYKQYESWQATALEDAWREDLLFLRTTAILKQFPNDKFLLVTGRCHAPYQIVNGPCNLWHFSSLARRLRETADTNYKTLSVALFYTGDNQIDSDLEDENPNLSAEIKKINNRYLYAKEARILSASLLKNYPVCQSNFDLLILNNRYPLSFKDEQTDEGDDDAPPSSKNKNFYAKPRLYFGYQGVVPKLNWTETNKALSNQGMPAIVNRVQTEFFLSILSNDPQNVKPMYRFSYGQNQDAAVGYQNTRIQASAAFNLISPGSPLRLFWGNAIAWQSHRITKVTGNSSNTFISKYEKPLIISNPMTLLGAYIALQYEIRFFFISGEIGYLRDLSNQRWKLDGNYTSSPAHLAGHHSYWNLGAGVCIPILMNGRREMVRE